MKYEPKNFETKWKDKWVSDKLYKISDKTDIEKFYSLYSYPYPSGAGLHVGHAEGMVANDITARYWRMKGKNSLLPMGWDSFGLPAENYAIKSGVPPQKTTDDAVVTFKEQINNLGISVDWDTEVGAHWPSYYKWTQWIFVQLFKKGLAYRKNAPVNWCPKDQTVLANEQVINGHCERCDTLVEQKDMVQWFFKITDFADRLDKDLEKVDWPESTKATQRNWIGRSEGTLVKFKVKPLGEESTFNKIEGKYKVESATTDDAEGIRIVQTLGWLDNNISEETGVTKEYLQSLGHTIPIPVEKIHSTVDYITKNPKSNYVVKENNVIIGWIGLEFDEENRKIGFGVYVHPDHRGKGVGSELMNFVFQKFPDYDYEIEVTQSNEKAVKLYKNLGFTIEDETKWFKKDDENKYLPLYRMTKPTLDKSITIFTTRVDTIFGATFIVIAPEHSLIESEKSKISNIKDVEEYVDNARNKTDLERQSQKDKTGIKIEGLTAINPFNKEEIPIYVADYVLNTYGTGAIMAVPAHDERDGEFAKKYNIPTREVVAKEYGEHKENSVFVDGVSCLVFNKSTGKYLALSWPKRDGIVTLIAGGKEEGESAEDCIKREILEEAGIKNIKEIYETVPKFYSNYWHGGKNIQRFAAGTFFLIVVDDEDLGDETKREEHENFDLVWLTGDEIIEKMDVWQTDNAHWKYSARKSIQKNKELGYDTTTNSELLSTDMITEYGILFESGEFTGQRSEEAIVKMQEWLAKEQLGEKKVTYRIRDWLLSRQRYWGCPIPIVYDPEGNPHAVDESDLPVLLPTDIDFLPHGESPIARSAEFKKRAEERYGAGWHYEVDTMDTFVDSSWYFFRHTDASNDKEAFASTLANYWLPTDLYMIGAEHIVLHLLYSRFFTKFFYDEGLIKFDEPFYKMRHMGTILGPDGRKMSKRWGNVINPNDEKEKYSSDTVRMYEMFMGPLEEAKPWNDRSENGVFRFLNRVWDLNEKVADVVSIEQERWINKLIQKVSSDIEVLSFNTAVAKFMEFVNFVSEQKEISRSVWEKFLLTLAPFAPFITEELWEKLGNSYSIHKQKWPEFDPSLAKDEVVKIAVQINGKVRGTIEITSETDEGEALEQAKSDERIQKYLVGEPKKVIYIKGKILNVIV